MCKLLIKTLLQVGLISEAADETMMIGLLFGHILLFLLRGRS